MTRRTPLGAALLALLLAAGYAWAPPPPRPTPQPRPNPTPRPPTTGSRPPTTSGSKSAAGSRPSAPGTAASRQRFDAEFEAARSKDPRAAAGVLRKNGPKALTRDERVHRLHGLTHHTVHHAHDRPPAERLALLRDLRADWAAAAPGLDPALELQLDALEAAAEWLVWSECVRLIRDGKPLEAGPKLEHLRASRHLPTPVAQAIPQLLADLNQFRLSTTAAEYLAKPPEHEAAAWKGLLEQPALPGPVRKEAAALRAVLVLRPAVEMGYGSAADLAPLLDDLAAAAGSDIAGRLRVELSAALFLAGRSQDAAKLLDGAVPPDHAVQVLDDLRAVVLGGPDVKTAQVRASVAGRPVPPGVAGLLPPDHRAKWQAPPAKDGEVTTAVAADAEARRRVAAAADAESRRLVRKMLDELDRVAAEAGLGSATAEEFVRKVEARLGRPLAGPVERPTVEQAAARGLTVDGAAALVDADADRANAVGRVVLAAVPVPRGPAPAFAARVGVAARPPAALGTGPDGGFRLAPADRFRSRPAVRDAVLGLVERPGGPKPLDRGAFEEALNRACAKAAGAPDGGPLTPAEVVQGLLDAGTELVEDHRRAEAERAALADDRGAARDPEVLRLVAQNRTRAAALSTVLRLLGEYGSGADAEPWHRAAHEWLARQAGTPEAPWQVDAVAALKRFTGAK